MTTIAYVRLPDVQNDIIQGLVKEGVYASRSAFIQEAVANLLYQRNLIPKLELLEKTPKSPSKVTVEAP